MIMGVQRWILDFFLLCYHRKMAWFMKHNAVVNVAHIHQGALKNWKNLGREFIKGVVDML